MGWAGLGRAGRAGRAGWAGWAGWAGSWAGLGWGGVGFGGRGVCAEIRLASTGAVRKEHRGRIHFTLHSQFRVLMDVPVRFISNIHFYTPNI